MTEGNIYLSLKNTHTAGEYTFDVNVLNGEEVVYSKELYIYSDGEVNCASVACIEECRDIYYTNFVASLEDLIILGKMEAPEDYTFTKTYYEVNTPYLSFIYEDDFITNNQEIMIEEGTESITVTGTIKWKDSEWKEPTEEDTDSDNHLHYLVNNYVYLYDDDVFSKDLLAVTQTDENGNFTFIVENNISNEDNGLDLFIIFSAENDACKVIKPFSKNTYEISTGRYINVNDGSHINYDIVINKNNSVLTNSFEVSQMMIYPREYAYHMSNEYLPQISVIYPNIFGGSSFNGQNDIIRIDSDSSSSWDIGMHEYGHYIDHYFGFSVMPGGKHYFDEDLYERYKKEKALRLAYSEAIATYIGISAQHYFELNYYPSVGDYCYSWPDGSSRDLLVPASGEANEKGIIGFLLVIADHVEGRIYDSISLGYSEIWELLLGRKENFSEFLTNFINSYPEIVDDIAVLLTYFNFSPSCVSFPNILDIDNSNNIFVWESNKKNYVTSSKLNNYSLIFYSSDKLQTYQINNIVDNGTMDLDSSDEIIEYQLSNQDFIEIMKLEGNSLFVQVIGYNTTNFVSGPYYGVMRNINKINVTELYQDVPFEGNLSINQVSWFKFVAEEDNYYKIYTTSYEDTYGEVFTEIVPNDSADYLIDGAFDDDSGEGYNFKIEVQLKVGDVIYIRVRDRYNGSIDEYSLTVSEHDHVYEYKPDGLNYHIRKCKCGETLEDTRRVHTLDQNSTTIIDGFIYKRCKFCNALVLSNSSTITPIQGLKPEVEVLFYRDDENI